MEDDNGRFINANRDNSDEMNTDQSIVNHQSSELNNYINISSNKNELDKSDENRLN